MEHLSNDHEDRPNQHKNSLIWMVCVVKRETDTTWSVFPIGGKSIVEHKYLRQKKEIQKSWKVRDTVRDRSRNVYHLSKVTWDYSRIHQVYQFHQNQKPCIKTHNVIDRRKTSKTLSEVKPVKNIIKNPQSFLEISLVQKEVLASYKLQGHAYE